MLPGPLERDRQRHSRLEQVRQLLRERRQLLQLRFPFLLQLRPQRRRQKRHQTGFLPVTFAIQNRARPGRIHGDGKKSEPLDLQQCRRTIGDFEDTLNQFTAAAARFIGKFRHNLIII